MSTEMEGAVESLVQRIVDGAGQRDPRFRCCHLIALHRGKKVGVNVEAFEKYYQPTTC